MRLGELSRVGAAGLHREDLKGAKIFVNNSCAIYAGCVYVHPSPENGASRKLPRIATGPRAQGNLPSAATQKQRQKERKTMKTSLPKEIIEEIEVLSAMRPEERGMHSQRVARHAMGSSKIKCVPFARNGEPTEASKKAAEILEARLKASQSYELDHALKSDCAHQQGIAVSAAARLLAPSVVIYVEGDCYSYLFAGSNYIGPAPTFESLIK